MTKLLIVCSICFLISFLVYLGLYHTTVEWYTLSLSTTRYPPPLRTKVEPLPEVSKYNSSISIREPGKPYIDGKPGSRQRSEVNKHSSSISIREHGKHSPGRKPLQANTTVHPTVYVNEKRPNQKPSIISYPVNDEIREHPIFKTFEKRKERVEFVCDRMRQITKLEPNYTTRIQFQRDILLSLPDNEECKPIIHPAGLIDNLFMTEEYKIRTCLPTKTGSTSWLRTLLSLQKYHGKKSPEEVRESWGSMQEKMPRNGWLLEEAAKSKDGSHGWLTLMTVRHPFARLYSAWKDKFRKGQQWLKVIENQFKPFLVRLEHEDMSESIYKYSFNAFVEMVALTNFDGERDRHWMSLHTYCSPCTVPYDIIIKQENGFEENDFVLRVYDQEGAYPKLNGIPKKSQWGNVVENHVITTEDMLEPWRNVKKTIMKELYKTYYLDFVYFDYSVDEFIEIGVEDDGLMDGIRQDVKEKLKIQSSAVKWQDTNHCLDSFDDGCVFEEISGMRLFCLGFKDLVFDSFEDAKTFACGHPKVTGIGNTGGRFYVSTIEGTLRKANGYATSWIRKHRPVIIAK